MKTLDYEIIKAEHGEWEVWTPDTTGAVIGVGQTERDAFIDAIARLQSTATEIAAKAEVQAT